MRYCRECGIPLPFSRFLEWTPDGTILGFDAERTRLVFLEVDEVRSLFAGVEARLGSPIDRLVYQAEKEVGRRFAVALIPGVVTRLPRTPVTRPRFAIRLESHFVFNYMSGLGMGLAKVLSYRSGRSASISLTDAHSVPLVAGDGAGFFEHMERVGVDTRWEEEAPGRFVVTFEKMSREPPVEERLAPEKQTYLPGKVAYDRCARCGIPREVTRNLSWELRRGVIRNTTTGVREVALPGQSFFAVFRELTGSVGEEVPSLLEDVEQEFMRESSGARRYLHGVKSVLELLGDFPWRGIGNPTRCEETPHGVEVTVENPFHAGMVAGRVAGMYEAWTDRKVKAAWVEDRPGRLKVTMGRP